MMFIKNNQVLEIKIAFDEGSIFFDEFIENAELERVSDYQWLAIKNPDEKRFSADDLKMRKFFIQGTDDAHIAEIVNDFVMYAFECPYYFSIDLIDAESGDSIDDDSLGGIYDDSYQLEYLFETITESLDNMPDLDKELRDMAVDELSKMDYSAVNW